MARWQGRLGSSGHWTDRSQQEVNVAKKSRKKKARKKSAANHGKRPNS